MVPVRLHGDNRVMMRVSLSTPASRFVKPTDAAGQGRLDPILEIIARVDSLFTDVISPPKSSANV